MARKDKGGKSSKKAATRSLKEKRQAKKVKKAGDTHKPLYPRNRPTGSDRCDRQLPGLCLAVRVHGRRIPLDRSIAVAIGARFGDGAVAGRIRAFIITAR